MSDEGKVRVSKLMSEQGLCSRREADAYIERGWVFVDGTRITELGTRIHPTQKITLSGEARSEQLTRVTILLNKPIGYVSGQAEQGHRPAITLIDAHSRESVRRARFSRVRRMTPRFAHVAADRCSLFSR